MPLWYHRMTLNVNKEFLRKNNPFQALSKLKTSIYIQHESECCPLTPGLLHASPYEALAVTSARALAVPHGTSALRHLSAVFPVLTFYIGGHPRQQII